MCRLGGEEFLIISEQEPIEALFNLKEKEKFNFSFGVCIKSAAMNLSDALKHADKHMYCMKSWKKNKCRLIQQFILDMTFNHNDQNRA